MCVSVKWWSFAASGLACPTLARSGIATSRRFYKNFPSPSLPFSQLRSPLPHRPPSLHFQNAAGNTGSLFASSSLLTSTCSLNFSEPRILRCTRLASPPAAHFLFRTCIRLQALPSGPSCTILLHPASYISHWC